MQVIGAETVISLASQAGQLELNVMMPVVQFNLLFAIEIFSNAMRVLATSCIAGITANDDRMLHYAESSASLVTALAPHIGYMESAKIAKEALASKRTIRSIVLEKKLMTEDQLNSILDLNAMTRPHQLEG
jgi:fumarate hydratase class II